jgi:hypothetical protein
MAITFVVGAVAGFIFGVLFGRKNKKLVENAVDTAKKVS